MGDGIDLITAIKELEDIKVELREMGEYRKANMLDFATGYLNKYLLDIRNKKKNDDNCEKRENNNTVLESGAINEHIPDIIRYEVHYWDKERKIAFYIGELDACYSLEDAQKHIDRLKLDKNVANIELWEITESIKTTKIH